MRAVLYQIRKADGSTRNTKVIDPPQGWIPPLEEGESVDYVINGSTLIRDIMDGHNPLVPDKLPRTRSTEEVLREIEEIQQIYERKEFKEITDDLI